MATAPLMLSRTFYGTHYQNLYNRLALWHWKHFCSAKNTVWLTGTGSYETWYLYVNFTLHFVYYSIINDIILYIIFYFRLSKFISTLLFLLLFIYLYLFNFFMQIIILFLETSHTLFIYVLLLLFRLLFFISKLLYLFMWSVLRKINVLLLLSQYTCNWNVHSKVLHL